MMSVIVWLFVIVIVPVVAGWVAWWRRVDKELPRTNDDFGVW
jgi:hypothetical protein